jgi:hypothetical protein
VTGRPRKGTSVRFAPADGVVPPHASDQVLGLRFNIEARYGGNLEVDLTDARPRPFAIAFAAALRRQSELGGPLGARSTIKQHLQGYLRFFAYLGEHSTAQTPADLRADDIEGYEAFLEAGGMKPIHRHTVLAKAILALRSIDTDQPGLLDESVRRRLAYTIARSVGRSQPRDAYGPFVARQLRDAARADIGKIFRRIGKPLDSDDGDANLRRVTDEANARIVASGRLSSGDRTFKSLYFMRLRRNLPVQPWLKITRTFPSACNGYSTTSDLPVSRDRPGARMLQGVDDRVPSEPRTRHDRDRVCQAACPRR